MHQFGRLAAIGVLILTSSCGAGSGDKPEHEGERSTAASPALRVEKLNRPFQYQQTFSNTTDVVDWRVTVTKVQCGITLLKDAADNPAYTSGNWSSDNVPPERIDAEPPRGQTFCRVDATLENVGQTPSSGAEDFGNIQTDKGEFSASSDDERIAANLMKIERLPQSPFNPGSTANVIKIWTIPIDAKPAGVLFPETTAYSGPAYRIEIS